jgi:hypothetical protein
MGVSVHLFMFYFGFQNTCGGDISFVCLLVRSFRNHRAIFVLLQKGEQVRNLAQGAVGNVKNTLGMGDKK